MFVLNVLSRHIHIQTHTEPITLSGPLKWSVKFENSSTNVTLSKYCKLQIGKQVARLPGGRFYPRPVGHDLPLTLQMPSFTPLTSADWLSKHGLKGNTVFVK